MTEHTIVPRRWKSLSLQVVLLGVLSLLVVGAVAAVPARLTGDAHTQLSTSTVQSETRLFALDRLERELVKERAADDAFFATPAEGRQSAVGITTAQFLNVESAWKRFVRLTPRLPGEAELRAQYTTERATFTRLASALLDSPATGLTPELVVATHNVQSAVERISQGYRTDLTRKIAAADHSATASMRASLGLGAAAVALLALSFLAVTLAARRRERAQADAGRERARDWAQRDLENRLQRGLAMLDAEEPCYPVVAAAVRVGAPSMATELLVADSSQAHFRQVLETRDDTPACRVMAPGQCPAASGGQTLLWPASDAWTACPLFASSTPGSARRHACP